MVLYEFPDDYGLDPKGSYFSKEYGSAGPRIACCTITPYYIDWWYKSPNEDDIKQLDESDKKSFDEFGPVRRRLADGEEVEVFIPEEFRELFGFEPEKLPGEDDWLLDQN